MDNRYFITVCSDRFQDQILLETQGDLKIGELIEDILKVLNWPIEIDGKPVRYALQTEEKTLNKSETLISSGIENFESIWISPIEGEEEVAQKKQFISKTPSGHSEAEPFWIRIPVDKPSLINPEGFLIILDQMPVLIGRQGGKRPVNVDLSEFEKGRFISSRCHAEITVEKGEYYLHAFQTRNGTFIGRDELGPDESRILKDKDIIQFGTGGVRLIFRKP